MPRKLKPQNHVWNYETRWMGPEQPHYERVGMEADFNNILVVLDHGKPDHSFHRKKQHPERKTPEGY